MKVYVVHNYSEPEAVFSSKENAALHIYETRNGEETRCIAELDVDDPGAPTHSCIRWKDAPLSARDRILRDMAPTRATD